MKLSDQILERAEKLGEELGSYPNQNYLVIRAMLEWIDDYFSKEK